MQVSEKKDYFPISILFEKLYPFICRLEILFDVAEKHNDLLAGGFTFIKLKNVIDFIDRSRYDVKNLPIVKHMTVLSSFLRGVSWKYGGMRWTTITPSSLSKYSLCWWSFQLKRPSIQTYCQCDDVLTLSYYKRLIRTW